MVIAMLDALDSYFQAHPYIQIAVGAGGGGFLIAATGLVSSLFASHRTSHLVVDYASRIGVSPNEINRENAKWLYSTLTRDFRFLPHTTPFLKEISDYTASAAVGEKGALDSLLNSPGLRAYLTNHSEKRHLQPSMQ